ncbi:MAG: hypothetical protein IJS95_07085, partial [Prevotella sp.]|nr:hypothetical protein [Prevotella sp.]
MKKLLLSKMMLLLCALVAGSESVWAAPGDEITAYTSVVSGKWYYIKGVYTSSKVEYTVYFGPTETDAKNTKVTSAAVTSIASAMPVLFTYNSTESKWTLQTPNGNYIRPHTSNGQSYFVEDAVYMTLAAGTVKAGTGIKIGPYVSGTDNWYFQANKTSAKIGAYKDTQWDVTLIEASAPAAFAAGKTMISFSSKNFALDFTDANRPAGLKAYKVSAADATSVTLEEVTTTVAKNTGLILTGTAETTYNIPVVATGTDISSTNKLVATDGTSTVSDAAVLSDGKFHPLTSGVIAAGKAYLPYDNITGGNP